jgi:hypothetical protein
MIFQRFLNFSDGLLVYNCCWSLWAQSFSGSKSSETHDIMYCLRFETPPTWRGRSPYLHPQEQGGPVMPPGTGFTFRRLLRLGGLRWRYSTPPPHGKIPSSQAVLVITLLWTNPENTVSNSSSIVFIYWILPSTQQIYHISCSCFYRVFGFPWSHHHPLLLHAYPVAAGTCSPSRSVVAVIYSY